MDGFHVEPRGGATLVTMDDGKVNAIGPGFLEGFNDAWTEASATTDPIVIAGNERVFGAGLDLKALASMDTDEFAGFGLEFMRVFGRVLSHERPVVAAVEGPAIAGGAVIALCADARIVTDATRMSVPEVAVGVPFPEPVIDLVAHRLPRPEAAIAILEGRERRGRGCIEHGWADELVDAGEAVDEALHRAKRMAAASPSAYRAAKAHYDRRVRAAFDGFGRADAEAWARRMEAQDVRAALEATVAGLGGR